MDLALTGMTAVVTGTGASTWHRAGDNPSAHQGGRRVIGAARTITPELQDLASLSVAADLSMPDGAWAVVDAAIPETEVSTSWSTRSGREMRTS